MEASSFNAGSVASSFEFLRNVGDFERYSSLLHSGSCTSPVSSFHTIDTSDLSFIADRRVSTGSTSPGDFANSFDSITSPLTPTDLMSMNDDGVCEAWEKFDRQRGWTSQQPASESLWLSADDAAMADCVVSDVMDGSPPPHLHQAFFYPSGRSKWAVDPTLSRAAVSGGALTTSYHTTEEKLPWANAGIAHALTVEPSATFQTVLPSSPATQIELIIPRRYQREGSSAFASSPNSPALSSVLASQWDVDDFNCAPIRDIPVQEEDLYYQALLPSPRKPSIRKQAQSLRHAGNIKSGIDCEAIITQNSFVCSISGCNKRFKRAEHRKRHENTVSHQSVKVGKQSPKRHYCWVVVGNKPCGRWFTRPDNLKSHKIKTHGKKSPNQRNAYVATLDEKSQYYDPGWEGATYHGRPADWSSTLAGDQVRNIQSSHQRGNNKRKNKLQSQVLFERQAPRIWKKGTGVQIFH